MNIKNLIVFFEIPLRITFADNNLYRIGFPNK